MITGDLRKRFAFFCEHAGYATPPGRAACALQLARAEILLEEAEALEVATFEVVDDDAPYDAGDATTPEEVARYFESGRWTGPFGAVLEIGEDAGSSLWGIVVGPDAGRDPYLRVVRAELASELEEELRQSIGDARDAETLEHEPAGIAKAGR